MLIIGYSRASSAPAQLDTPTVIGTVGRGIAVGTNGTLEVAAFPDGITVLQDDMALVVATGDQAMDSSGPESGVAAAAGYTSLAGKSATASPGYHIAYKRMGATPDSSVEIVQNGVRPQAVAIAIIRGVGWDNVLDGSVQSATGGSGTMPNPPSLTTGLDSLRVVIGGIDDCNSIAATAPAGFTNLIQYNTAARSACVMMAFQATAAGTLDPAAFGGSYAGETTTEPWVAFHFAFRGEAA